MRKSVIARYISGFAALLLIWQLLSMLHKLSFLPAPLKVFICIYEEFIPEISCHALWSLIRILAGVGVSIVLGAPAGLCMGYFKAFGRLMLLVVYFTYPVPKLALLPLVMLIFGLGEASKIIMITLIIVFQVIVACRDAATSIPKETFYVMTSLGSNAYAVFRRIILPASLPSIITAVKISLGTALSVLFFTETFGTQQGLGYYIMDSWMRVDYTKMFSGITVLCIMGLILFMLIESAERRLCAWRENFR